jgi:uncharacterized protein YrzB (UPF0473 family)
MKIKFNHDEKDTAMAFGITDAEHTEAAINNTLAIFLEEEGNIKTFSKLGEFLQDHMSDNEILLLATQQVYEAFRKHEAEMFDRFIQHIKKLN